MPSSGFEPVIPAIALHPRPHGHQNQHWSIIGHT